MEVLRRNTDYALRIVTILAQKADKNELISSRLLAKEATVPLALACKLLQRLQREGIVQSVMGARGGFKLARQPREVTFLDVIQTIQGPIHMNRCLLGGYVCPLKNKCPLHGKMAGLEKEIREHLQSVTFYEVVQGTRYEGGRYE